MLLNVTVIKKKWSGIKNSSISYNMWLENVRIVRECEDCKRMWESQENVGIVRECEDCKRMWVL